MACVSSRSSDRHLPHIFKAHAVRWAWLNASDWSGISCSLGLPLCFRTSPHVLSKVLVLREQRDFVTVLTTQRVVPRGPSVTMTVVTSHRAKPVTWVCHGDIMEAHGPGACEWEVEGPDTHTHGSSMAQVP